MTAITERLRVALPTSLSTAPSSGVGLDRTNRVLRGMVVAIRGDFKSPGRGSFNGDSLSRIVMLGNQHAKGLRSHFTHASLCSDSLGSFLGRAKNFRHAVARRYDGEPVTAVRADLHFDRTAFKLAPGWGGRPLGEYVMDLIESDSDALSTSLVLHVMKIRQLDERGKPKLDEDGEELPPIWLPRRLDGTDLVGTGDAVDGILSGGDPLTAALSLLDGSASRSFPNEVAGAATAILDRLFSGRDREDVAARIAQFTGKYLDLRFPRR